LYDESVSTIEQEHDVKFRFLSRGVRWSIGVVAVVVVGIGFAWGLTLRAGRVITSGPGAGEGNYRERVFSVRNLPASVDAPDGKLTLFADYGDETGEGIALYVVNRTNEECQVPFQDGDIYAKREVRLPDGTWQRAQTHRYSFCGNSYGILHLQPGQFLNLRGFRSSAGEKYAVRYRLYGTLDASSNIGTGNVPRDQINEAAGDEMEIRAVRIP